MINEQEKFFHLACRKKISWSAILSGALVGVGLTFLLGLFSVSIGLTAFVFREGAVALSIGGLIGAAIGIIASMFVAGWVAGALGRPFCLKRNLGILYGFNAWCIALLLMTFLSVPLARHVAGYTHFITNPYTTVEKVTTVEPTAMRMVNQAQKVVNPTGEVRENLAMTSFIVFVLFFLGALSSSFGGYCGMNCRCSDDDHDHCELR